VPTVIERLRVGYEALSRDGDFSAILEEFDPGVEFLPAAEIPEGLTVYKGREGLTEYFTALTEAWQDMSFELLGFEKDGNRVLAVLRMRMRGRATELPVEREIAHLFTLGEADKVVRIEGFFDLDRARDALRGKVG
jgi:ketosteroid isomerase-like protein